jgi:hypothetical protein
MLLSLFSNKNSIEIYKSHILVIKDSKVTTFPRSLQRCAFDSHPAVQNTSLKKSHHSLLMIITAREPRGWRIDKPGDTGRRGNPVRALFGERRKVGRNATSSIPKDPCLRASHRAPLIRLRRALALAASLVFGRRFRPVGEPIAPQRRRPPPRNEGNLLTDTAFPG